MGTIKDYINWRGDLEFWQDGFNVIDNLVLSCISYVEMDDIFTNDGQSVYRLKEISDLYFEKIFDIKKFRDGSILKEAPLTLKIIAETNRYKNIRVRNYVSMNDTDRTLQFAAMEFLLPDGTSYIAYRGTDDTVVGWKEDFMLALKEVEAEKEAVNYINKIAKDNDRLLRVGGHSKGGHLSVYAAAKCEKNIQKIILNIYSNDGPGFMEKVAKSKAITSIIPKLVSIIPEDSVVGLLMEPVGTPIIVKSTAIAIQQHNLATWCLEGTNLQTVRDISVGAKTIDKVMKENINKMTDDEINVFVEELFSIFDASGASTLTEFKKGGIKSLEAISQKLKPNKK